jgi:hypothetical protein
MVQEQARLAGCVRAGAPRREVKRPREQRNARAAQVLAAFEDFDRALMALPGVRTPPDTLAIFRLDDAPYTRAAWYAQRPQRDEPAPLLEDLKGSTDEDRPAHQAGPARG